MKTTADGMFVLIEASKLSPEDAFLQYEPKTMMQELFKKRLVSAIKRGVKDFYRPRIDPSFTEDGTGICYKSGRKPAVGKSYNCWVDVAKNFNPDRKSRLGKRSEYVAFLGVLIKTLVAKGWSVDEAWLTVCNDSKKLGHYRNSKNAKDDFELTGSREIGGFFDLANTYKVLADDEGMGAFWLAGGTFWNISYIYPLAYLDQYDYCNCNLDYSVGWLVLESSTDH
ncbi:MAG: hypothetical protein J6M02_05470 [Clostridia bacterium]|nr:hypothetical protein [Clostridia bacterium]